MKEIWRAKVAIIPNVEFQHAVPLGVKTFCGIRPSHHRHGNVVV